MENFDSLVKKVNQELSNKLKGFASDEAEILVECIINASKVAFLGPGPRMSSILGACVCSFKDAGITADHYPFLFGGYEEHSDTLLIVVDLGDSQGMIPACQEAISKGATVLSLTTDKGSLVSELAHECIQIPSLLVAKGEDESIQPGKTLTEQSILVYLDIVSIILKQATGK